MSPYSINRQKAYCVYYHRNQQDFHMLNKVFEYVCTRLVCQLDFLLFSYSKTSICHITLTGL